MATFDRYVPLLYPPNFDLSRQSYELPNSRIPGYSGIYRNAGFELITHSSRCARKNLLEVFQSGLNLAPNGNCLGYRPIVALSPQITYAPYFVWQTYIEVDMRRQNVGSAFHFLRTNGRVGGGDLPTAGIWSYNRPEWQIIDLALQAYGGVSVSIYDTLGPDAAEFTCNHSEISIVFSTLSHLPALFTIAPKLKFLKVVVCIEEPLAADIPKSLPNIPNPVDVSRTWASQLGLEFFTLSEFETLGSQHFVNPLPADPEQIYSICYTSGTSGTPKGVIFTHGQCAATTLTGVYGGLYPPNPVFYSILPLSHCFGRIKELTMLNIGFAIGYMTAGDPTRIIEDMQILRPNEIIMVPRLLNRFYQVIRSRTGVDKSKLKAKIFKRAIDDKLALLREARPRGLTTPVHPIWDRLIFNKIRSFFGGKLLTISTGASPIAPEVLQFFRAALGCYVIEGVYGLTETAAVTTKSLYFDFESSGTVGPVQPSVEVRLKDVPEIDCKASDKPWPRGEILCRGLTVFTRKNGYYKDPEATAAAIDQDGWFHTGDVGEMGPGGRISIIDRIKNVVKLSQGEYVGLEKVESTYSSCPVVSQICVHADSLRDYPVAIIVPDVTYLNHLGITFEARDESLNNPHIIDLVSSELDMHARRMELRGFEKVRRFYLTLEPFTIENAMLTPTFKLRRRHAYVKYKHALDKLYTDHSEWSTKPKM